MSFVVASPEYVAAAASDLADIGSALSTANAAAAPTIEVLAAGADEVSAAIAAFFGAHAQSYQALSEQASAFHLQFVQAMTAGAGAYAGAEAVNASPLQAALDVLNAPAQALFGRPLIGDGANGAPGQSGGDGGLLYGNGGNGGNGRSGPGRRRWRGRGVDR
ncbi:PE family protein [Mycobacterium marinum]|nr:PE family protein [Mycobacterium marinum]RFZ51677.1 PE family protein [Mycobacterium marinum]RFZ54716.1 PE family protein [Mycobacterium marinum]